MKIIMTSEKHSLDPLINSLQELDPQHEKSKIIYIRDWLHQKNYSGKLSLELDQFELLDLSLNNSPEAFYQRVFYVRPEWFSHFENQDRHYAQCEFEAFLGFALGKYKSLSTGRSAELLPLPEQWKKIKHFHANWQRPHFYFGPLAQVPEELKNCADLVVSDPWDLFNFKTVSSRTANPEKTETDWSQMDPNQVVFIWKRPLGTYWVLSRLDDDFEFIPITSSSDGLNAEEKKQALITFKKFNFKVGELILAKNQTGIHFISISPFLIQSAQDQKKFKNRVIKWLN